MEDSDRLAPRIAGAGTKNKVNWDLKISDNFTKQLVQEEMERQLLTVSDKVAPFVKRADIMTYALNRLPALYAATNRGRLKQETQARRDLGDKVKAVVHQAIMAIVNDPLRTAKDSWRPPDQNQSEKALAELRDILQYDVTWENLASGVRQRLVQAARGEFYLTSLDAMDWEEYPLHQG